MEIYSDYRNIPEDDKVDWIYIELSDNRIFRVPSEVIANDYAEYYSNKHDDRSYEEEKEYAYDDPYQLYDWLGNNMNWEDIEEEAEFVEHKEVDPSEELYNAEFSFGVE